MGQSRRHSTQGLGTLPPKRIDIDLVFCPRSVTNPIDWFSQLLHLCSFSLSLPLSLPPPLPQHPPPYSLPVSAWILGRGFWAVDSGRYFPTPPAPAVHSSVSLHLFLAVSPPARLAGSLHLPPFLPPDLHPSLFPARVPLSICLSLTPPGGSFIAHLPAPAPRAGASPAATPPGWPVDRHSAALRVPALGSFVRCSLPFHSPKPPSPVHPPSPCRPCFLFFLLRPWPCELGKKNADPPGYLAQGGQVSITAGALGPLGPLEL